MRPIVLALAITIAAAPLASARTCKASFYGAGERLNRHTASGEVYRPHGITAAHRTLPFGSRVKVVHGNRSVVVRINDRGPAKWTGRCIDLSLGAARKLGMVKRGGRPRPAPRPAVIAAAALLPRCAPPAGRSGFILAAEPPFTSRLIDLHSGVA